MFRVPFFFLFDIGCRTFRWARLIQPSNLYSLREYPLPETSTGLAYSAAPLLGIRCVSSPAGTHRAEFARRPRYLRRHAYGRREIAVLSIAGGDAAKTNRHRCFA